MNTTSAPLLSLIVPVYNVAPYLPRCLESLAALTPPADEIIVVDDGSTDDCPRILADFAPRLPQMRIIRQENGGLSAARNTGLNAATGNFIAFVDSDDFLSTNAYAEALAVIQKDNLDMVLFNAEYHFEGRKEDQSIHAGIATTSIISGRDWLRLRLRENRLPHMVWMHLYRRSFIEQHNFRFIPRLVHEDVIWTTNALLSAKKLRYLDYVAVHYRIPIRHFHPDQNQRRLATLIDSSVTNALTLDRLAAQLSDDPELAGLLRSQMLDGALSIFHKLAKMPHRRSAQATLARLRQDGFLSLLWRHAHTFAQRRRIAKRWLQSWFAGSSQ
jgi:heptose III glucuronosyltransferase